jgi:glucan phosphoethanolaminetransferase (alkaline phosphatase superfamily)
MLNALVYFVIYIMIVGLVIGLLLWLIDQLAGVVPDPFRRVARIAVIVIGVLIVIVMLLGMLDGGTPRFKLGDLWPALASSSVT